MLSVRVHVRVCILGEKGTCEIFITEGRRKLSEENHVVFSSYCE